MVVEARFLLVCAGLLVLPAIAAAQTTPPPLPPGWYSNGSSEPFYKNDIPGHNLSGLQISWGNSYIYAHPGNDPLYWYAQVVYLNKGSKTLTLWCTDPDKNRHDDSPLLIPGAAKEHMRGTANSGSVAADETHCSRNPTINVSIEPGAAYFGWAIFHNVPWKGGEVSLEWGDKGSSLWVDPWHFSFDARPPAECPRELETLGTCPQVPSVPHPAAYQIAQEINKLWKRFSDLEPKAQPASLTDGIIAAGCLTGTMAIVLRDPIKAYIFEVKCVQELQTIAKKQCNNGDYACFIKYMLAHPTLVMNFIPA